jgi:hypothetical protein
VASRLIDKEKPDVSVTVLARSSKYCVVSSKLNDVVKLKNTVVNLNHGAPPSIVVMRAPMRVNPRRYGVIRTPPITTVAVSAIPATEGAIYGWVKVIFVIVKATV